MTTWGDLTGHTWGSLFTWGDPLGSPDPNTGLPFLQNVTSGMSILFEFAWGADLSLDPGDWDWTDVTADVRIDPKVSIIAGRADATSFSQFATGSFQLNNDNAKYSPYTRISANYPNVRKGTPCRISVDPGSGFETLFFGFVPGWPPSWDVTGKQPITTITAGGILRRLGQGSQPLRSALYRALTTYAPTVAYWPMEIGSTSNLVPSAFPDGVAMTITDASWSSVSGFPGSDSLPVFSSDTHVNAQIDYVFSGQWHINWFMNYPSGATADTTILRVSSTGTVSSWTITVSTTQIVVTGKDGTGSVVTTRNAIPLQVFGSWQHFRFSCLQVGTTCSWNLIWHPIDLEIGFSLGTSYTGTAGGPYNIAIPASPNLEGLQFGHLIAFNSLYNTALDAAQQGWIGETADVRFARLCTEQGVPFTIYGASDKAMGPQPIDTFSNLLAQCQQADGGSVYDGFDAGIRFQCQSERFNMDPALVLDVDDADLSVLAPTDDDQDVRNLWTVSLTDPANLSPGVTFEDTDGPLGTDAIGVYDDSTALNLADGSRLLGQSSWRVHQGTVEGLRYPQITMDFAARPSLIADWLAAGDLGYRTDIDNVTNAAPEHPPGTVELVVEGVTHTIDPFSWTVVENCSPYSVYEVATVGDNRGRVDTIGSSLHAGITASSASFLVDVTYPWATTATFPADFPFPLDVGGEEMTCTGITGTSSPQTFAVTRLTGATSHSADESVSLWQPAVVGA